MSSKKILVNRIAKRLKRKNLRQFRYKHVFKNKIYNFVSGKYKKRKKKIIFFLKKKKKTYDKKKHMIKKFIYLFNNKYSFYPLLALSSKKKNLFLFKKLKKNTNLNFLIKNPNKNTNLNLSKFKLVKSYLYSKLQVPFISYKNGIFLPLKFNFKLNYDRSFRIKKIFYSFLRPNEYKKSILESRKKFLFNKIVSLSKINKNLFKRLITKQTNLITFFKKNNLQNNIFMQDSLFLSEKINLYSSKLKNDSTNKPRNELRIPRVRFKPGYQRLWRNFRLALAELLNFKFIYQQQLTKYLMRFYRKLNQSYFSFNENNVQKVLIYSRLVPDLSTFNLFFNNKLIFVNNTPLINSRLFIYKNDFIQLEISNWYYIFSRWLINSVLNRNLKFKSLIFKKSLAGKYKIMKQVKQRSNYTPKWISTVQYDFADIKPFLEVDFFTLSVFYLFDYNMFLYYAPNDIKVIRYNLFRLYNWKYIN